MVDSFGLASFFAELSQDLLSETDEPITFSRVARRAVEVVPGCVACGITMRRGRGRSETVAATNPTVTELDNLQYDLGEGPCLDAAVAETNCVISDMRREHRWPRWSREASSRGIGAMLCVRLRTDTETLGALNMYAERPGAFDADNVDIALIFSAHAAEAMNKAKLVGGLQSALETRHLIGIAQGVLAQRYGVSYETAFEVLRRHSNEQNIKLREVAQQVVELRHLPHLGDDPPDPELDPSPT